MSVRLKDLDPAARKRVKQSAARRGSPAAPTGSPRRKKPEGLEVRCHACNVDCSSETAQARHTKDVGHHRFEAVL